MTPEPSHQWQQQTVMDRRDRSHLSPFLGIVKFVKKKEDEEEKRKEKKKVIPDIPLYHL